MERHPAYEDVFGGVVMLPMWWDKNTLKPSDVFVVPMGPSDEPDRAGYKYLTRIDWMQEGNEVDVIIIVGETTEAEWNEFYPPEDDDPSLVLDNGATAYIGPDIQAECAHEAPPGGFAEHALSWLDPSGLFAISILSGQIAYCEPWLSLDTVAEIANSIVPCNGFERETPACYRSNRPDNR